MKYIQRIFVILFFSILVLPVLAFNHTEGAISEIDNRKLAPFPLSQDGQDAIPTRPSLKTTFPIELASGTT